MAGVLFKGGDVVRGARSVGGGGGVFADVAGAGEGDVVEDFGVGEVAFYAEDSDHCGTRGERVSEGSGGGWRRLW